MESATMGTKMVVVLKEQINKLETIRTNKEWDNWKSGTSVFIARIYDEKTPQYLQFEKIYISYNRPNIPNALNEAKSLLESYIKDIETFGLPQKNKPLDKSIKFENNNIITQTQNIELNIIFETLKDEIPQARMREIEEIVKSSEPQENKLQKIVKVLKKAGENVIASTLAKIIGQSLGLF